AIVNRLNAEIAKIQNRAEVRQEWASQGAAPMVMTPEEFARYLDEDIVKWERIVKISGAKPDQCVASRPSCGRRRVGGHALRLLSAGAVQGVVEAIRASFRVASGAEI